MIELNNVSVSYFNYDVLKNIELNIEQGLIYVIVGKNGCGKTTLLKALNNLVEFNGEIMIDNQNIKNMSNIKRAQKISYLPQKNYVVDISVAKLVSHGRFPYNNKIDSIKDKFIIKEALVKCDVYNLKEKYLYELSGGEMQRAYLAMILAQDSNVIILDEPCSYLDIDHQLEILKIIKEQKKFGKTMIVVLHDLQQAFTYADKIIVIDEKTIINVDSPENIVKNNIINKIFDVKLEKVNGGIYDYVLKEV